MKNRKDIGQLIEKQLNTSFIAGKPELWEQIDQKLDKRKRRRLFFLWLSTATAIAILLFINFNGFQDTVNNNPNQIVGDDVTEQELTEHQSQRLNVPLESDLNEDAKRLSNFSDSLYIQSRNYEIINSNSTAPSQKVTNKLSKNSHEQKANEFDGFQKNTTYHYYSSTTDETISSDNKKWADSIISEKTEGILSKDSLF